MERPIKSMSGLVSTGIPETVQRGQFRYYTFASGKEGQQLFWLSEDLGSIPSANLQCVILIQALAFYFFDI